MVVKVYVAMISCSQEVKKNQQRAIMILESKKIPYSITDITDPSNEDAKDYMVENAITKEGSKVPVTPQIFNEADYCGDYDGLDMANECDTLGDFLKLTEDEKSAIKIGITGIIQPEMNKSQDDIKLSNGVPTSREISPEKATIVDTEKEVLPTTDNVLQSEETTPVEPEVTEKPLAKLESAPTPPAANPVEDLDESSDEDDTTTTEVKTNVDGGETDGKDENTTNLAVTDSEEPTLVEENVADEENIEVSED